MLNLKSEIIATEARIRKYLPITPLIYAHQLSAALGMHIHLKLENIQPTRSFKVRGAFNKLLSLSPEERNKGIITASTGNHGAAVAYGCKELKIKSLIVVPRNASSAKVNSIKSYGAEVMFQGSECGESEKFARQYAVEHNMIYISPYNDAAVILGQGTIGYELMQQLKAIDAIFIPVGGGGLIGGVAGYLKSFEKSPQIIGCLPENSPVMAECIRAGKVIEIETRPTLSDATAGNMDLDSITFEFCKQYVDDFFLVSEEEIKTALCLLLEKERILAEGSVGTALAALRRYQNHFKNQIDVIIVSGANISLDSLRKIID